MYSLYVSILKSPLVCSLFHLLANNSFSVQTIISFKIFWTVKWQKAKEG